MQGQTYETGQLDFGFGPHLPPPFGTSPGRVNALPKWRLRRVQEYITAGIAERITLSDLASVAGLSRMHFAAQFRAATGRSPHDYLLQQRIGCAKAAMAGHDVALAEVALSVGFQTQSHFSTVFKRMTGESPGRWQRHNRGAVSVDFPGWGSAASLTVPPSRRQHV